MANFSSFKNVFGTASRISFGSSRRFPFSFSHIILSPLSASFSNYVHLLTLSLFNSLAFFLYVLISFLISVLVSFHLSLLMPFLSIITCVCLSISTCVFPFYLYLCFSFSLLPFSTYLSVYLRFFHSLILFTYTSLSLCPM